jgi:hypothetical protein
MLTARWDAVIQRVIVENRWPDGRLSGYARLTRHEFDSFLDHAAIVRHESWGNQTGDPWDGLEHVTEPWPDEVIELGPAAVLDDPEADLPAVVRLADGSARVDLEFGDDGRLERRLSELGRE